MSTEDFDPFDQSSTPAVSWTTPEDPDVIYPVGTKRYFEALGKAEYVQQRNFDTGEPDFWPTKRADEVPQKKMAAVVKVIEHDGVAKDAPVKAHQHKQDEEQALWAGKAAKGNLGALFNQIAAAQKAAGGRIDAGSLIQVELVDKKKDPGQPSKKAQNVFEAKVALNYYPKRESAEPQDDPFASAGSGTPAAGPSDGEPPF
jgi:hypothetical protein